MHDIRLIRTEPAAFDAGLARRGFAPASERLLALDSERRAAMTAAQERTALRNTSSARFGQVQGRLKVAATVAERFEAEKELEELRTFVAAMKGEIAELEATAERLDGELSAELAALPNLPADDVPEGADETGNAVVHLRGTPRALGFEAKEHDALGERLGLDFEAAARIAGARFAVLRGGVARLHRALGQFMLDVQTRENGYTEVIPPVLVRGDAMFGTGQLPKFGEDSFQTTDGRWLIPTAEVSLTNIAREQILSDRELPLRFCALTPCFRSEAGAAGRDTRGMIRQHQFEKVELVSIVPPDQSEAEHERMTACAEGILDRLGLAYRRMLLCAGDMGFTARKTYDLEVWLPGQNQYREISSCSNCGDFQARRMDARFKREGEKGTQFLHTLNGSGLAVGRTLVAVLETYQQADGSVAIPDALLPYMGGLTVLEPM
ncbi:MAG: serine--tRNA ligase [Alphaproteobacteria bacterium]|nr:serine--tRNA ligase [Alphaproteobacteria bacterium]